MAGEHRGRALGRVRVVSLSLLVCAVAAVAGLALTYGRTASAQAPDEAYRVADDSPVDTADQVADASLQLDKDPDPTSPPHTPKLSTGDMTQSQYIDKLTETPDVTDIQTGTCTVQ